MSTSPFSPTQSRRRPTALGAAALVVTFAAVTAMGAVPAQARRSAVACGMVLRTSLTLNTNLGPCSQHGITIDASNVTLDLNGHTITGSVAGTGIRLRHTDASHKLVPHENVVVKNGTVRNFHAGVAILNGNYDLVTKMKLLDNRGNDTYGDGIIIDGDHNTLSDSDVKRNGPLAGVAIISQLSAGADFNTIQNNIIEDNNVDMSCPLPPFCHNEDEGVRIEELSADNSVIDNTITNSGLDGVGVYVGAIRNLIKNNEISGNGRFDSFQARPGDGIRAIFGADGQRIQGNRIHDNYGHGIALDSVQNVVNHENLVVDNGLNPNFVSYDGSDHEFGCDVGLNTWHNNTIGTKNFACIK